ncbi:hypothetical protein [Amycolatopsis pittospori]|uniref:hypothetical protein n=1 Tax=Amycolatopsis pittospori TaxID=2749434 RepID=UPI001A9D3DE1|nr:hypothetical protein [Amycolatopsis pittospori]
MVVVDKVTEQILEHVTSAASPCVWVTGPAGVGRSTLLARLHERLSAAGYRVSTLRFTAEGDAGVAVRAAATTIPRGGGNVLLLDDTQWIDHDTLAALETLIRRLDCTSARLICATRTPVRDAAERLATVRRLRAEGLVLPVRLLPLKVDELTRPVAEALGAVPSKTLRNRLHELSRGVPAALRQALDLLRAEGAIRIVDRRAYLVPGAPAPLRSVGLAPEKLAVAKAAAVLHPLGEAMPALISEVLAQDPAKTSAMLEDLRADGVLHRGRTWRFTVPVVASALIAELGPFERRRFSAAAVTALWEGKARTTDPYFLADRLAEAGKLVDPRRALSQLLGIASTLPGDQSGRGVQWLRAAVELTENRGQRAAVTLLHTTWCSLHGDHEQTLAGSRRLLEEYPDRLSAGAAQEVQSMAIRALHNSGGTAELTRIASNPPDWSVTSSAIALSLLDRWAEAAELLAEDDSWRTESRVSARLGGLFAGLAELWTGRPARFGVNLTERERWPLRTERRHRADQIGSYTAALLVLGERARAEKLLSDEKFPENRLHDSERSMLAALRGDFPRAVDLAHRSVADRSRRGHDIGSSAMHLSTVSVLVSQGRFTAARELLTAARATAPPLAHLLDIAEARVDGALGEIDRAGNRLRAATCGLSVGTDIAWADLAELALLGNDRAKAKKALDALEDLASALPSGRVLVHRHLVRACLGRETGEECLWLAQERAHPLELAIVAERLVRHGAADPKVLLEVYEVLGSVDALFYRARLRGLMREHEIPIPGQQETAAENERLLVLLAGESLTNEQLAKALRTNEKSVERRLSRLATRMDHRSRIELATTLLNGGYAS